VCVWAKAFAWRDPVFVHHSQSAKTHASRILVIRK